MSSSSYSGHITLDTLLALIAKNNHLENLQCYPRKIERIFLLMDNIVLQLENSHWVVSLNGMLLNDKLILQTFSPRILLINKHTLEYHFEERRPTKNDLDNFIGKFHFIQRGVYRFSTKNEDPEFSPKMLKGG